VIGSRIFAWSVEARRRCARTARRWIGRSLRDRLGLSRICDETSTAMTGVRRLAFRHQELACRFKRSASVYRCMVAGIVLSTMSRGGLGWSVGLRSRYRAFARVLLAPRCGFVFEGPCSTCGGCGRGLARRGPWCSRERCHVVGVRVQRSEPRPARSLCATMVV